MAEFLIYYKDPCGAGRVLGDIIHVMPNGSEWGNLECIDDFLVVSIPEMSLENARQYVVPLTEIINENIETVAKSRFYLDINSALEYDELARVYCEDWTVPVVEEIHIKDKSNN